MGKTFKDRKDVRRNNKEISKLKKKNKSRIKDKFDENYRRYPDGR